MKVTSDRETQMGDGPYIEQVGGDSVNTKKTSNVSTTIVQQGGTIIIGNESETNDSAISESSLNKEPNQEKQYSRTFVFTGTLTADDEIEFNGKTIKIEAIFQHLEKFCDGELTIIDISEGSVRLTLGGSPEDLERLQKLFASGELNEVLGIPVQEVQLINTETKDYGAKIENDEKSRLVTEIKTKYVPRRNLSGADLSGADLSGADLNGAYLNGSYLSGADLSGADLSGANLSGAYLILTDLNGADLSGADLSGVELRFSNLSGANLNGANLIRADLIRADLSGANLIRADLSGANLNGADLSGANLIRADLSGVDLIRLKIDERTKLTHKWRKVWEIVNQGAQGKDLSNIDLSSAYMGNIDLSGTRLVQSNLSFSNLYYANLSQTNLIGANLSNAFLLKANLTDADLSGANVENTHFGYNSGISSSLKRDLIARGAIFEDSPGDRSRAPTPV